ncbi:MAG: 50S ribosomal protein L9 [Elusimicrobia bacterium]|nr:50S ribosomal protein L9 [Elusimicrobiota bacterium]
MKVILKSDVASLGRAGEIKDVSSGFGRNFLIPNRLAMEATPSAVRWWERGKEKREKLNAARRSECQELAGKIAGLSLSFSRPAGPEGKIFGSVGKTDIVKSLKTCGFSVDKDSIRLETAIKQAGEHEVEVRLLPDVGAKIKITVVARE